jgi:hypothetical protein
MGGGGLNPTGLRPTDGEWTSGQVIVLRVSSGHLLTFLSVDINSAYLLRRIKRKIKSKA